MDLASRSRSLKAEARSPLLHSRQKRSRIIKLARLPLRPQIQPRSIHDDLPIRSQFHMRPVHRTRRRPFKVHAFAVISASVARALELVFARLPVRRASQMCAARINDEETIGCAIHPDAELLLPFGIHAKRILRRISDLENRVRFKKRARQEEAEERKEPC